MSIKNAPAQSSREETANDARGRVREVVVEGTVPLGRGEIGRRPRAVDPLRGFFGSLSTRAADRSRAAQTSPPGGTA